MEICHFITVFYVDFSFIFAWELLWQSFLSGYKEKKYNYFSFLYISIYISITYLSVNSVVERYTRYSITLQCL